jgi:putative flippase GtrA
MRVELESPSSGAGAAQPAGTVVLLPDAPPAPPTGLVGQFVRYLVVGGVAFVADAGTLALLTETGVLGVLGAAALGFLVGTAVNYLLATRFVFRARNVTDRRVEFAVFVGVGLVGLGLNELLLWGLTMGLGLHYLASKVVSAGVVLAWNFGARKVALFRG